MKLRFHLNTIMNRPNVSDLESAKEHRLKLKKHEDFKEVQRVTQVIADDVSLQDGLENDYSSQKGRVITAGCGAHFGGYWDGLGRHAGGKVYAVDADVAYTSSHKKERGLFQSELQGKAEFTVTKAHIEVKPSSETPAKHIGVYEYEKSEKSESWTHTPPGGESTRYTLSNRGYLTVEMS